MVTGRSFKSGRWTRQRILVLSLGLLAGTVLWFQSSGGQTRFSALGSSLPFLSKQHTSIVHAGEPVSIVLLANEHDHAILEVSKGILKNTVGPYELVAVFTTEPPRDLSQVIVEQNVAHHRAGQVDTHGRGLKDFKTINLMVEDRMDEHPIQVGLAAAKYPRVIVIHANDEPTEFGWDRLLLMGLKADENLIAVSGKAAGNLRKQSSYWALENLLGQFKVAPNTDLPSPPNVQIRDVALRSPIIYDGTKLKKIGGISKDAEDRSFGDLELCARAARLHGYTCGYFPIPTWSRTQDERYLHNEPWNAVKGTMKLEVKDNEARLETATIQALGLEEWWTGSLYTVENVPVYRKMEDIPRTIVFGFSGNHLHVAKDLYRSIGEFSPWTRAIGYILPSGRDVDNDVVSTWTDIEMRTFDYSTRPEWVQVDHSAGEYAWKFQIVEEVIRDYGGLVLWLDAGDMLSKSLEENRLWNKISKAGAWSTDTQTNITTWTHPAVVSYFNVPETLWPKNNCNGAMFGFNTLDAHAMTKVVRPVIQCAHTRECIAPIGTGRHNHRQDQAGFTILMAMGGYSCLYPEDGIIYHRD